MMSRKSPASGPRLSLRLGARQPLLPVVFAAASLLIPASAVASTVRVLPADNSASVALGSRSDLFTSSRNAYATSFAGSTTTSYSAAARTHRTGVLARFGHLGRIDLDFEPTGHRSEQSSGPFCQGGPQITWKGVYVGTVHLQGRYGFRSFHDRSFAKRGTFSHRPRWVCHLPDEPTHPTPEKGNGILLWADACDGRSFSVQSERPRSDGFDKLRSISYAANASLRDGSVRVDQGITALAAPETFSFDEALTTATVSPPSPFHGVGTLSTAADGKTTWSGSLSATLFGRQVPLSGPGFKGALQAFPKPPGTGVLFTFPLACPGRDAVVSGQRRLGVGISDSIIDSP
jgi:hypothetical protein